MVNEVQAAIQQSALGSWIRAGMKGSIGGATGMGKSKIAIDAIVEVLRSDSPGVIYLIVPTEELRDKNWPEEFRKWGLEDLLAEKVRIICYASAHKVMSERVLLVVFDEIHHLTTISHSFMVNNLVRYTLGLSATVPGPKEDIFKHELIRDTAPLCFVYTLDQGVEDGVISDFEVLVIMEPLDNITKNIDGGTKKKPFKTTEAAQYKYLDNMVKKIMASPDNGRKADMLKFAMLRRSRFIYNLPSKTRLAADIIKMLPQNLRVLFFCGSIEQSRELFGDQVYNSKDKHLKKLEEFKNNLDMKHMGVVNAVDEGHNIPQVDSAVVIQVSSVARRLVQRIGRVVRYRPGHKALVIILCSQGTQDESWIEKSTEGLGNHRITKIPSRQIYTPGFFDKWA